MVVLLSVRARLICYKFLCCLTICFMNEKINEIPLPR